jgi:hypothetical protein
MTHEKDKEGLSMRHLSFAGIAFLCLAAIANAAGFVHNDNFLIFTESSISPKVAQDFANSLMTRAEAYRKQIAEDWLGRPLPAGIGRATINLRFSESEDTGLTWAIDHPSRKTHTVYLVTSADKALGTTLAHEMVHVVLATRFPHPHRLPAWLEEGIASQYDDENRKRLRADKASWWVETEVWPNVENVLSAHNIQADDREAYAVSAQVAGVRASRCPLGLGPRDAGALPDLRSRRAPTHLASLGQSVRANTGAAHPSLAAQLSNAWSPTFAERSTMSSPAVPRNEMSRSSEPSSPCPRGSRWTRTS